MTLVVFNYEETDEIALSYAYHQLYVFPCSDESPVSGK